MARIPSPRRRSVVAPGAIFVIMAMALTGTAGTAQELGAVKQLSYINQGGGGRVISISKMTFCKMKMRMSE